MRDTWRLYDRVLEGIVWEIEVWEVVWWGKWIFGC